MPGVTPEWSEIRVLIVGGDALMGDVLQPLLEKLGYRVVGRAGDGQTAIQKVLALRPSVVLMAIELPDMDGIEATRRIHQLCPTPVVVLATDNSPDLMARAGAAGVGASLGRQPKAAELEWAINLTLARFADMMELRRLNAALQAENAERRRAEHALRQRHDELALLCRVGRKFSSTLNLEQVLDYVLDEVRQLLQCAAASVWLRDSHTQELVCYAVCGVQSEKLRGWRLPPGVGLAGWVASEGISLNVSDARSDPRYYPVVDQQIGLGLRSILGVPLRVNEQIIGVLQVLATEVERFHPADQVLVESLAASAAIAIDNAGLYQEVDRLFGMTQTALNQTEALYYINRLAGELESSPRALQEILERVARVLDADQAILITLNLELRTVTRLMIGGNRPAILEFQTFETLWEAGVDRLLQKGALVRIRAGRLEEWESPVLRAMWDRLGLGPALGMPLHFKPCGGGVLAAVRAAGRPDFDSGTAELLLAIGNQLSTALENANLVQSLRESESRFRALVQMAGNVIICLSPDLRILEWNQEAERVYGWSREAVLGKNYLVYFLPPADWEWATQTAEAVLAGQMFNGSEFSICNRDGTVRHLLWSVNRLLDSQGRPVGLIASGQDITERKQAEERVVRSRDFYLTLFDEFPMAIWRSGADGYFDYFNRTWQAFTRRTLEQETGLGWIEGLAPEDQVRYLQIYREAFAARQPFEFEGRLRHHSGEYRWLINVGRPFEDLDGHFAGYIGFCYDLTERKQAEEALSASEARYRTVVEDLPMLVCRFLPDGTLSFVNQTYVRYFAQPRDALVGRNFLTLLPEAEREPVWRAIQQLTPENPVSVIEYRAIAANGELRWQRWVNRAVFEADQLTEFQAIGEDITEYRRAAEALRDSEEQYRQLFETSRDGIAITDLDGRLMDCNPAFLELLGYTGIEELRARPYEALSLFAFQRAEARLIGEPSLARQERDEYELEYVRKNDTRVQLVLRAWLRRDSQGQPTGIWVMVHDITERKRVELALQALNQDLERQARELAALNRAGHAIASTLQLEAVLDLVIREVRTLLDAQRVSVLLYDSPSDHLVFAATVGPGARLLLGMPVPATAGMAGWVMQNRGAVLSNEVRQDARFDDQIDRLTGMMTHSMLAVPLVFKGAGIGVVEAVNKAEGAFDAHDLAILQGMAASAAIAIENARLYAQVQQELAERKRTEEELRHLNADLLALNALATRIGQPLDLEHVLAIALDQVLAAMPVESGWIQLMDEAQAPASLTLAMQRGVSLELAEALQSPELVAESCHQMLELNAPYASIAGAQLEDNSSPYVVMVPLKSNEKMLGMLGVARGDGRELDAQDLQLLATIGHQVGVAIENVQLAEKTAEIEVLRQLDRLRSELIANVSHELRTPLGLIKIFTTTLMRDDVALDGATYREFLKDINEETDRLQKLVDNLLDLSRMQDGRMHLDKQPHDVRQVVQDVIMAMDAQFIGHRLELDWDDEPLVARFDSKRIEQVLRNLFYNAIKYSPEGGAIGVHARHDGQQLLVWVSDQGIGIPPEHLEKVFERFYRVENTFTQSVSGVGLGLAVCRGIVEAHHGRIWAESRLGEGSTFYFTLPADEKSGEGANEGS